MSICARSFFPQGFMLLSNWGVFWTKFVSRSQEIALRVAQLSFLPSKGKQPFQPQQ